MSLKNWISGLETETTKQQPPMFNQPACICLNKQWSFIIDCGNKSSGQTMRLITSMVMLFSPGCNLIVKSIRSGRPNPGLSRSMLTILKVLKKFGIATSRPDKSKSQIGDSTVCLTYTELVKLPNVIEYTLKGSATTGLALQTIMYVFCSLEQNNPGCCKKLKIVQNKGVSYGMGAPTNKGTEFLVEFLRKFFNINFNFTAYGGGFFRDPSKTATKIDGVNFGKLKSNSIILNDRGSLKTINCEVMLASKNEVPSTTVAMFRQYLEKLIIPLGVDFKIDVTVCKSETTTVDVSMIAVFQNTKLFYSEISNDFNEFNTITKSLMSKIMKIITDGAFITYSIADQILRFMISIDCIIAIRIPQYDPPCNHLSAGIHCINTIESFQRISIKTFDDVRYLCGIPKKYKNI